MSKRSDGLLIAALGRFLRRVRALRPEAVIVVLLPSAVSMGACIDSAAAQEQFAADMDRCWSAAAALVDDPRLFLEHVEPRPPCVLSDRADWGQMGHWSTRGNAKWADAVVPLLAARLGWDALATECYPASWFPGRSDSEYREVR